MESYISYKAQLFLQTILQCIWTCSLVPFLLSSPSSAVKCCQIPIKHRQRAGWGPRAEGPGRVPAITRAVRVLSQPWCPGGGRDGAAPALHHQEDAVMDCLGKGNFTAALTSNDLFRVVRGLNFSCFILIDSQAFSNCVIIYKVLSHKHSLFRNCLIRTQTALLVHSSSIAFLSWPWEGKPQKDVTRRSAWSLSPIALVLSTTSLITVWEILFSSGAKI